MRRFIILATLVLLAGCGGGGGGASAPLVPAPVKSTATVQKAITIIVPGYNPSKSMRSQYVSRNTQGIGISFGASPATFPAATSPTAAFDVSLATGSCTVTNAATGARTCTVTVGVPPGTYDFQVTAWDAKPTGASFSGANALSSVTVLSQPIASGVNTPLNLTLNGIVNSVTTSISPSTIAAFAAGGTPVTATVSVNALDADGNVILDNGSNWIDGSGNVLTIYENVIPPSNGGPISTTSPSMVPVTPAASTFTVTYSGGSSWGTYFQPTVTGSGGFIGAVTGATLNITPTITLYSIPTANAQPWRIASANDGNLYFTESNAQQLGQINASTGSIHEISVMGAANEQPTGIVQASDGNIWFVMYYNGSVANYASVPPGANFTAANIGNASFGAKFASMNPYGSVQDLVDGGDGCMYASEPGAADLYGFSLTSTTCSSTSAFSPHTPVGVVKGPDGNIWYADSSGTIGYYPRTGSSITQMATIGGNPSYLTVGSDNNIWFTVPSGGYIQNVSTSGTLSSQYPAPSLLGGLGGIVSGTDGALWIAGGGGIGRATTSGVFTVYNAGLTTSDNPFAIAVGPDGNIWFTETTANKIGRLIY